MKPVLFCRQCTCGTEVNENEMVCTFEPPKLFTITMASGDVKTASAYPPISNQTVACSKFRPASEITLQ